MPTATIRFRAASKNHFARRLLNHPITIAVDGGTMNAIIGLAGRLLLDHGVQTYRVIDFVQAARATALVSDEAAFALMHAEGFRFTRGGRELVIRYA